MKTLAKQVLEHAAGLPEGTPLVAKEVLHLGSRAAVDQVLSRLVQRGALMRAGRGIYVLPVESRFGSRAPSITKMIEGLAAQRGESIVSHGAAVSGGLNPRKSGGGKRWRNLVARSGVHFRCWIPAAAFGAGCTNDKGP
jgi:hypothetical protein